jgi:hypothetical protein
MPSLKYYGPQPDPYDITSANRNNWIIDTAGAESIISSLPINQTVVESQIITKASLYATKNSLDTTLTNYATRSYMLSENSRGILSSQIGVQGGIAGTDSSNKVPLSQLPSMGNGFVLGPFGVTAVYAGDAGAVSSGPFKFAEWAIGTNPITFKPIAFMVANVYTNSDFGRPVIEIRITNGPATAYSSLDPLVAMGTGRKFYTGLQPVAVMPCNSNLSGGSPATNFTSSYNTYLTAWIYDAWQGRSAAQTSSIVSAGAYLLRVTA